MDFLLRKRLRETLRCIMMQPFKRLFEHRHLLAKGAGDRKTRPVFRGANAFTKIRGGKAKSSHKHPWSRNKVGKLPDQLHQIAYKGSGIPQPLICPLHH